MEHIERSELEAHIVKLRWDSHLIGTIHPNWIAYLQLELLLKILDTLDKLPGMVESIDDRLETASNQLGQIRAELEYIENIVGK